MFKHKNEKKTKIFSLSKPAVRGASVLSMALHINYFLACVYAQTAWTKLAVFLEKSQVEWHDVFKMSHLEVIEKAK